MTLKENRVAKALKRVLAVKKAQALKREAEAYFDAQVHHCCRVSANNHSLAYAVHRVGPFGGPRVEQIARPDVVQLSELDDCIVVKDGNAYELTRSER